MGELREARGATAVEGMTTAVVDRPEAYVSRDRRRALRSGGGGGLNFNIFTMTSTGNGQTALVIHPSIDGFPDW